MARCKDPLEREFYLRMTAKFGWTKNVLIHQIDESWINPLEQMNDDIRSSAPIC